MSDRKRNLLLDNLREEIRSGKFLFGSFLPTETELAQQYDVSRPTIAKVYNTLEEERLVKKKAGSGTVVIYNQNDKGALKIGLLLPGAGESEIFELISDTILSLCEEKDIRCLSEGSMANNADLRQTQILRICQSYIESKVDGVLFSPLERTARKDEVNEKVCTMLDEAGIPLVLIDRDIYSFPKRSKYNLVGIDNFEAGYTMAHHLISGGCNIVSFVCMPNVASSVMLRIKGYQSALLESGIQPSHEMIVLMDHGIEKLMDLVKINTGRTGILCANDNTAALMMQSLKEHSIKTPSEVQIAGFDDIKYAKHLYVPLTTYRQPCEEIAWIALEMLYNRNLNINNSAITVQLRGELIQRESTLSV